MRYIGTIRGDKIELEGRTPLPDGTRVHVSVEPERPEARRGSRDAILRLVGTLTPEEADVIEAAADDCRRVDRSLWTDDEVSS